MVDENIERFNNGVEENCHQDVASDEEEVENLDNIYYEPLVHLPEIDVKTLEEDEETLWKCRAKLYRFERNYDDDYDTGPQWKERGVGDVKLLKHKKKGCVRLLMRREQTLKICANHYVLPNMKLLPHSSTNRSWIWTTMADFADEEPKMETLALRFKDAETCKEFEYQFENAKTLMEEFVSSRSAAAAQNSTLDDSQSGGDCKPSSDVPSSNKEEKFPDDKSADDLVENVEKLSVVDKNEKEDAK